jgi:hypothetical protein
VGDTGGEINEISGADALGFPFDLHNGLSFQHQKGLLGPGVGVRFGLSAIFNFSEDHLHAIRAQGTRPEEAPIASFGMTGRRIKRKIAKMGDISFHLALILSSFLGPPLTPIHSFLKIEMLKGGNVRERE